MRMRYFVHWLHVLPLANIKRKYWVLAILIKLYYIIKRKIKNINKGLK